jgi:hypothetical protein
MGNVHIPLFGIVYFDDHLILIEPIESWPVFDVLITFIAQNNLLLLL